MEPSPREPSLSKLPSIEPNILGLPIGEVRSDKKGRHQVYFGGSTAENITQVGTESLRDGAIQIDMYTLDGRDDVDYAKITVRSKASSRTPNERARAIRGHGTSQPVDYIERTPVQYFFSRRGFVDIPISGRARWLAIDPEGNFSEGLFDSNEDNSLNRAAMFGKGWTFVWIVEGSRPFQFGELCNPRFIDTSDDYPLGEEGIEELDTPVKLQALPQIFQDRFAYYTSGEHLRQKAA